MVKLHQKDGNAATKKMVRCTVDLDLKQNKNYTEKRVGTWNRGTEGRQSPISSTSYARCRVRVGWLLRFIYR
jgi:hypothetical protein